MPKKLKEGQEPKDSRMSISGEYSLIKDFQNKCANNSTDASKVLRNFMIKYLGEEEKYGIKKTEKKRGKK